MSPLFAQASNYKDAVVLGAIFGNALAVTVCAAIVFLAGVSQQKVTLGVVGAVGGIGAAAWFTFVVALAVAVGLAALVTLIPRFGNNLLSESEVEAEMRRARLL